MSETSAGGHVHPTAEVHSGVTLGHEDGDRPPVIGEDAVVRSGSIIYSDVAIGDRFVTGHDVLVREETRIGDDVVLGTKSVVDGHATIESNVSVQTGVYIPPYTHVSERCFLGPNATLTNDPYPLRTDAGLSGPTLEPDVSVGANATVLPDVTLGRRSFVAAGAVVTESVPPNTLAVGTPAVHRPLPEELKGGNDAP